MYRVVHLLLCSWLWFSLIQKLASVEVESGLSTNLALVFCCRCEFQWSHHSKFLASGLGFRVRNSWKHGEGYLVHVDFIDIDSQIGSSVK